MDSKYSSTDLTKFYHFKNEIKELLTYPELQYSIRETETELKATFPYAIWKNEKNGLVIVKFAMFINQLAQHKIHYEIQKYNKETIFLFNIDLLNAETFTMPDAKTVFFYSV